MEFTPASLNLRDVARRMKYAFDSARPEAAASRPLLSLHPRPSAPTTPRATRPRSPASARLPRTLQYSTHTSRPASAARPGSATRLGSAGRLPHWATPLPPSKARTETAHMHKPTMSTGFFSKGWSPPKHQVEHDLKAGSQAIILAAAKADRAAVGRGRTGSSGGYVMLAGSTLVKADGSEVDPTSEGMVYAANGGARGRLIGYCWENNSRSCRTRFLKPDA